MGTTYGRMARSGHVEYKFKAKSEGGKKTFGIAGRRFKDEIKRHLADICFDDMDLCYVAQVRIEWWDILSSVMNFGVP